MKREDFDSFNPKRTILVWDNHSCPKTILALDTDDDLDWVCLIPPYFDDRYIGWCDSEAYGCNRVTEHHVEVGTQDGKTELWTVKFGYHA